jgi:fumarylacetoacetate (FAA) hydrolase family protein
MARGPSVLPVITIDPSETLPADGYAGTLAGRVWRPEVEGPSVVAIRADGIFDVTDSFPTMRDLCETRDPAASLKAETGERIGTLADILSNTPPERRDTSKPWLLAPVDLQAIKAAGVTFAISMIERVIEERARGNPQAAEGIRQDILRIAGGRRRPPR